MRGNRPAKGRTGTVVEVEEEEIKPLVSVEGECAWRWGWRKVQLLGNYLIPEQHRKVVTAGNQGMCNQEDAVYGMGIRR